ncbi:hypothetical protein Baya_16981 [Bagarius yarrelli]|uniref:Uncharacterized protein n=1 Tax=Bagarius yarrelli TaxID=175774 RepID=A0A556VX35_BAGYA|nr:hypothetical protein Baya_16981 [Bagarius yarrelli]
MEGLGSGSGSVEKPSKAAECLNELNRIIEAQHELLERQKSRIAELELQVAELRSRNARVHEEKHASLPVETSSSVVSPSCRRRFPCRQWKSASFRFVLVCLSLYSQVGCGFCAVVLSDSLPV